jgi:hypothetical protein
MAWRTRSAILISTFLRLKDSTDSSLEIERRQWISREKELTLRTGGFQQAVGEVGGLAGGEHVVDAENVGSGEDGGGVGDGDGELA